MDAETSTKSTNIDSSKSSSAHISSTIDDAVTSNKSTTIDGRRRSTDLIRTTIMDESKRLSSSFATTENSSSIHTNNNQEYSIIQKTDEINSLASTQKQTVLEMTSEIPIKMPPKQETSPITEGKSDGIKPSTTEQTSAQIYTSYLHTITTYGSQKETTSTIIETKVFTDIQKTTYDAVTPNKTTINLHSSSTMIMTTNITIRKEATETITENSTVQQTELYVLTNTQHTTFAASTTTTSLPSSEYQAVKETTKPIEIMSEITIKLTTKQATTNTIAGMLDVSQNNQSLFLL